MVNKCTKNYFFFYLRLKTLTRHPLSGNEMIEYCYCKTRPLKILTVCSRDTPEQDASPAGAPLSNGVVFCCFLTSSCSYTTRRETRGTAHGSGAFTDSNVCLKGPISQSASVTSSQRVLLLEPNFNKGVYKNFTLRPTSVLLYEFTLFN